MKWSLTLLTRPHCCPECLLGIQHHCPDTAGKLPTPVAAHLTANGGWVEFYPSSPSASPAASSSDPSAPTVPTLRPLAWFRFSTQEEQTILASHLEAEVAMHGRETEFLHNHELPWWLGDADIHHVADHWRGLSHAPSMCLQCTLLPL